MAKQKKEQTMRDVQIVAWYKQKFTPSEIRVLLEREGFRVVSRIRILQIVEAAGIKTK